ncbi:CDP-diacylglycerol--glycerol-3-phosphate 3-phosphatidyltransferase [Candidatus Nanopelagicus hibericus]|uniref:CDP-diacylglycerol--glycerol-3-phosphate 3-phosphatidyltransferase n=1 Tax=Candidatus Nanopelagicus hibericus TaxID=1884915 RepID=A0A249K9Q8_9ACTN|nr:CDP-diacylglycerol--glycerol-3-phosphate 3-phosphatidyltransferase [Candidatus Nanopelagicus hibericus]ASY13517.1 CDP-diacylglycerol--glycerol-3-phosphate 3-phosphatidyltransferase [Candidatus Nanopelagicus hibericus]
MINLARPNLPNTLTILRILALPICAYALFKSGGDDANWRIIAFTLFFVVGLSDVLDGKIARDRNQITEFGKLLDPIADKAMLATATIGASMLGLLSWWVTGIFLIREVAVTVLRFAVIKAGVIPASRGGKLKTFFQNFGVGFYILPLPEGLFLPRDIFMGVAIYLTIATGVDYFRRVLKK